MALGSFDKGVGFSARFRLAVHGHVGIHRWSCWRRGGSGFVEFSFFLLRLLLLLFGDPVNLIFINCVENAALGNRCFAIDDLTNDGVARNAEEQVFRVPLHGRELGETRIEIGQVETRGMKLLLKPIVEPDRADHVEIAGARTEGETIRRHAGCVSSPCELARLIWRPRLRVSGLAGGRRLLRPAGHRRRGEAQTQKCGQ